VFSFYGCSTIGLTVCSEDFYLDPGLFIEGLLDAEALLPRAVGGSP